jgi:hypothetical protein
MVTKLEQVRGARRHFAGTGMRRPSLLRENQPLSYSVTPATRVDRPAPSFTRAILGFVSSTTLCTAAMILLATL